MEQEILIGRNKESAALNEYINSNRSEFIAIYGRRRVGKTFLIRQTFHNNFAFYFTGSENSPLRNQLTTFAVAMQRYSHSENIVVPQNWILAFAQLSLYIEKLPEGPKVIFIDELPCLETPKSGFISALENFWNSWASARTDIKLIVCGSATSWMINNIINDRGGLHNRTTHRMLINPFSLSECEEYFKTYGFGFSRHDIAECYMIMGGIPYYMSFLKKNLSLSQNIDKIFFSTTADLNGEFSNLYKSLFKKSEDYITVVRALAEKRRGLNRQEILKATGLTNNGRFSEILTELEQCGFIREYYPFGADHLRLNKKASSSSLFQLVDFYTIFYFDFIASNGFKDEHYWSSQLNTSLHSTWAGLAFERLCLHHIKQLKSALGIASVLTHESVWRSNNNGGAQIDLLIDRADNTVNVCEMKYTKEEYSIDNEEHQKLQNRLNVFLSESKTKKTPLLTMITNKGLTENSYSGHVQVSVTLNELFNP